MLDQNTFTEDIVIGIAEMKVIERMLMQLYCQNDDSEHFREILPIEIVRWTFIFYVSILIINFSSYTTDSAIYYESVNMKKLQRAHYVLDIIMPFYVLNNKKYR